VGRGNVVEVDVERLLRERSGAPAAWTAPPSGLFLERVKYGVGAESLHPTGQTKRFSVDPNSAIQR
jgi:tRNA U38,U39,U40 pseudouridine synthase TruA